MMTSAIHILVVSPIPSHPQFQGNSARIFNFCRLLQTYGFKVHFLYAQYEDFTPLQQHQMSNCWDYFYNVKVATGRTRRKSHDDYFGVDDWYDERIGEVVAALQKKWHYRVAVVNYVWISKCLEKMPNDVFKIIDTHDIFGDRHLRSEEFGLKPQWFYTSVAEEARGLKRADLCVAIQDDERQYLAGLGVGSITVGYTAQPQFIPVRNKRDKIRIGYIGSSNPWNVHCYTKYAAVVSGHGSLTAGCEFVLAGPICEKIPAAVGFEKMGVVAHPREFYNCVDVVVNPMIGGTGLKIKSIEALSYGRPLLSTVDGTVGVHTSDKLLKLPSVEALVDALAVLSENPERLNDRATVARSVYVDYLKEQLENFNRMVDMVAKAIQTSARIGSLLI